MLAMHAPDGYLEPWVAAITGVVSLGIVVWCIATSKTRLPYAAMAAGFVFSAQMLNFPVASGTTGHLLGAALAAILLGPRVGTLVVTAVVVVQAVVFADGGVTALGHNVLNMAIVPAFGGWALFSTARRAMPATPVAVLVATMVAATGSVVLSAAGFSLEWAIGGTAPVSTATVFASMAGVHAFIGIGEGLISVAAVAAVLATRPDLVGGARDLDRARPSAVTLPTPALVTAGVLVTSVLAAVVSQTAAAGPDGLERVALDLGFATSATDHLLAGSPFADYATQGVASEALGLALAGLVGVAVTFVVVSGLLSATAQAPAGGRR